LHTEGIMWQFCVVEGFKMEEKLWWCKGDRQVTPIITPTFCRRRTNTNCLKCQ